MNKKEEMRSQLKRVVKEMSKDELDMMMELCAEEHKNRKQIERAHAIEDCCKAFNYLSKNFPETNLYIENICCDCCGDDSNWVDVLEHFSNRMKPSDFTF